MEYNILMPIMVTKTDIILSLAFERKKNTRKPIWSKSHFQKSGKTQKTRIPDKCVCVCVCVCVKSERDSVSQNK